MINYNKDYYAVLLAGGVGSRFWPVSTSSHPKQFHDMMGLGETLIQQTFNRLVKVVPAENILILTNKMYADIVQEQLPKIKRDQIILEPEMRNTAPAILLATLKIHKSNKDALVIVAPSDHWIEDEEEFAGFVNLAFDAARQDDNLITLGVKPKNPNTGYGYIQYNKEENKENDFKKVLKFTEKPKLKKAKAYLEEGNYLWNSGIFIWKTSSIIKAFKNHQKDMFNLFNAGEDKFNKGGEDEFIRDAFPKAENISIDYAILEKSKQVYVIPVSFVWDDLGTWGALYSKLAKDSEENAVVNAQLVPRESGRNIVHTSGHKIVVVDGLSDYIIVDDKDVLMIVPKEKEQEIKAIRAGVMEKFGNNLG